MDLNKEEYCKYELLPGNLWMDARVTFVLCEHLLFLLDPGPFKPFKTAMLNWSFKSTSLP